MGVHVSDQHQNRQNEYMYTVVSYYSCISTRTVLNLDLHVVLINLAKINISTKLSTKINISTGGAYYLYVRSTAVSAVPICRWINKRGSW